MNPLFAQKQGFFSRNTLKKRKMAPMGLAGGDFGLPCSFLYTWLQWVWLALGGLGPTGIPRGSGGATEEAVD